MLLKSIDKMKKCPAIIGLPGNEKRCGRPVAHGKCRCKIHEKLFTQRKELQ